MKKQQKLTYLILLFIAIVVFDQITKAVVYEYFSEEADDIALLPFFNIVSVWNYGISFGVLNNEVYPQAMFIVINVVIVIGLILWSLKHKKTTNMKAVTMIVGGAIGNLLDRLYYGAVLDFLDFHINNYHYPAFNIADSFIVIGAFMLVFMSSGSSRKKR